MTTPRWLASAAVESANHGWALGSVLKQYQEIEELTSQELADDLGCSPTTLRWICLCRRPAKNRFAEDVSQIAARFNIDLSRLVAALRRVEVVSALRDGLPIDADDSELLLAARDRKPGSREDP